MARLATRFADPTEVVTSPERADALAGEWRELAERVPDLSYFSLPDWMLGWWETGARGHRAEIAVWRSGGGTLEAVVPLVRRPHVFHPRSPWAPHTWTNLGSGEGTADHFGWAVLPARVEDARRWIASKAADGPVLLHHMDPVAGVALVPADARRVQTSPCPRIRIPDSLDDLGRSRNSRRQMRAQARRLERRGVTFRWVPPEEMDDDVLEVLFRLHPRRRAMKREAGNLRRDRAPFLRRLAERAGRGRGPAAVIAEFEGRPIGVEYGFLWRDVFADYQTGWDPAWAPASLGTVLVRQAVGMAGAAGARIFDLLRGDEPYKYRFGATDRVDESWLLPSGLSGRALDAVFRLKARRRRRAAGGDGD